MAPAWRPLLEANGWRTLDDIFALENDAQLAKPGLPPWRERLRAPLIDPLGHKVAVYVKRFHRVPLVEQVRRWIRGDRYHGTAWTEWLWLCKLARAGVAAAEPIAFGEEMLGWWERRSAVVIGAVPGVSLERWCAEHAYALPPAALDGLAELVARFHALGIAHRDLYLAHVFGAALDTETPRLALIDLQRVVRMRWSRRWIVKDLAALNYSTPATAATVRDRLRWFKRYLHLSGIGESGLRTKLGKAERTMLRQIVARTEKMRQHDARRRARAT